MKLSNIFLLFVHVSQSLRLWLQISHVKALNRAWLTETEQGWLKRVQRRTSDCPLVPFPLVSCPLLPYRETKNKLRKKERNKQQTKSDKQTTNNKQSRQASKQTNTQSTNKTCCVVNLRCSRMIKIKYCAYICS